VSVVGDRGTLHVARADRIVVLMANSYPLTPEADAAIHRTLDDAFCGATG
jgi:hypothetical protein